MLKEQRAEMREERIRSLWDAHFEQEIQSLDQELASARDELRDAEHRIDELENELRDAEHRIDELENDRY